MRLHTYIKYWADLQFGWICDSARKGSVRHLKGTRQIEDTRRFAIPHERVYSLNDSQILRFGFLFADFLN